MASSRPHSKKPSSTKALLAEIAGWYGALAIITAYALSSFEFISSTGVLYQVLNLTGAIGVIIIAIHKRVKQSIVLNIFWSLVAIIALLRIAFY